MKKERLFISFSGGRTSAFMLWWPWQFAQDKYEMIAVFANTGHEHPKTLRFVHRCAKEWGIPIVWVEADIDPRHGHGTRHKVVTFKTASREGEPYRAAIKKYGLATVKRIWCTKELKVRPMHSYLRSIGWEPGTYLSALGIRADEVDRMDHRFIEKKLWYPLIKLKITKRDIRNWWSSQPFDLGIQEHEGNCLWCYEKSLRKLLTLMREDPSVFDFPQEMERKYSMINAKPGEPFRIFRGERRVSDLRKLSKQDFSMYSDDELDDITGADGCTESCEIDLGEIEERWVE